MRHAVRRDLVAARVNAPHQIRMMVGDVAEHEERRLDAVAIEQIENRSGRLDDLPLVGRLHATSNELWMEPVLEIDAEAVYAGREDTLAMFGGIFGQ